MESFLVDTIRPFWLKGINTIEGLPRQGVKMWLTSGSYYFDLPVTENDFSLSIRNKNDFISAVASDFNRFCLASFESASYVSRNSKFPKAVAWLVISSYYSAFFAAHGILRLLGLSCIQVDAKLRDFLNALADTGGFLNQPIKKGFFVMQFDSINGSLQCKRSNPLAGGAHEVFWDTFRIEIDLLRDQILLSPAQSTEKNTLTYTKIGDLIGVLTSNSHARGTWLSAIRNKVNYAHELESWYPHRESRAYYDQLFRIQTRWHERPENIQLSSPDLLKQFLLACCFLTSLCKALTEDLSQRCITGTSFLRTGASRFLKLAL